LTISASLQPDTVAGLMASFRNGDRDAAGRLVETFYPELRRIAAARMRAERRDHTLQPTALVHQLYLELVKVKALRSSSGGADERTAFLGLAAYLMKRLLIQHARPLSSRAQKIPLPDFPTPESGTEQALLEIDDTLNRLALINPALRQVVELRVFQGLTRDEIAAEMGCGTATVGRQWTFARSWLEDAFTRTPNQ
jgi:RNA polymerase sigma factor (TIGR02999 family)